jgi:hypothetical protein
MSDYLTTHGDLAERHFVSDFNEWLDSLPQILPEPLCGQCQHFEARFISFDRPNGGVCRLRKQREWVAANCWISTMEARDEFQAGCEQYREVIPF